MVLHTYGSHFNYQERYPRNFAFFKPDSKSEAKPENRRDLLNAYDNTIRYTDYILHGIIERLQNGRRLRQRRMGYIANLHRRCSIPATMERISLMMTVASFCTPPRRHLIMSCMFLSSSGHQMVMETISGNTENFVWSSYPTGTDESFGFHTMLGIGGILTRYRQDEYSVASEKYHPVKLFIWMIMIKRFHRKCQILASDLSVNALFV